VMCVPVIPDVKESICDDSGKWGFVGMRMMLPAKRIVHGAVPCRRKL
jgi:hypothetical protein